MFDASPNHSANHGSAISDDRRAAMQSVAACWLDRLCRATPDIAHAAMVLGTGADDFIALGWPDQRDAGLKDNLLDHALATANGTEAARGQAPFTCRLAIKDFGFSSIAFTLKSDRHEKATALAELFQWSSHWLDALLAAAPLGPNVKGTANAAVERTIQNDLDQAGPLVDIASAVATSLAHEYKATRCAIALGPPEQLRLVGLSNARGIDRRRPEIKRIEQSIAAAALSSRGSATPKAVEQPTPLFFYRHYETLGVACAWSLELDPRLSTTKPEHHPSLESICDWAGLSLAGRYIDRKNFDLFSRVGRLVTGQTTKNPARRRFLIAGVIGALMAAVIIPLPFKISAPAYLEGAEQRAVVAPFDGFLSATHVRPGMAVAEGQALLELDTTDLRLRVDTLNGERNQIQKEYDSALADLDQARARIEKARLERVDAELAMVTSNIERSALTAGLNGVIVRGDLSRELGSPVSRGQVLAEIAPLDNYRIAVYVSESDIRYIDQKQAGAVTFTAIPNRRYAVAVKHIVAVADSDQNARDGLNRFRVEAELLESSDELRPGMEGVAKIEVGRASLAYNLFRHLFSWIQMTLWTYLP